MNAKHTIKISAFNYSKIASTMNARFYFSRPLVVTSLRLAGWL